MIRVDGWSSPRVLDSMLGVSTFLQNQILMDSYYLEKNIRGIWNFLVFEVFFCTFQTVGTLGGMVASALAAASFGRRRRRDVLEVDGELDLMARVDKGVEEIVNEMEGRQELGMLEGMLNRFWNIFT